MNIVYTSKSILIVEKNFTFETVRTTLALMEIQNFK